MLYKRISKGKEGGFIYCDNWDNDDFWGKSRDYILVDLIEEISSCQNFVDYVPAQVGVYEGLLVRKR